MGDRVGRVVRRLLDLLPRETFYDRAGDSPYLSRWYLAGDPDDGKRGRAPRRASLFMHCIHRSDDDRALHNHPWAWSVALVLSGGYSEERRVTRSGHHAVVRRRVGPGTVNVIRGDDFHRVDLLSGTSWSLFLAGPKVTAWGFWERETGEFTLKDEFIRNLRARRDRSPAER